MNSEAQHLCELGKQFLDRGEPEEALRCYERAIDVDPDNSDAWCGRGKAAYDLGRLERADRDFLKALRLARRALHDTGGEKTPTGPRVRWWADPATRPYLRALHGHGLCRFWLGSYEDAARVFRKLLKLAPTDPLDVRFLVGETYLRMGRIERAVRELARVEEDPDALYNLGLACFWAGDFPGSVNALRRGFFANLHLPALLCERPGEDLDLPAPPEDGSTGADGVSHPKGLDNAPAAHDYLDRCGDLWFGRPVQQRWLDGIRRHPVVEADVARHIAHLKALSQQGLAPGERARIEGENTALRSAARLAASDRRIAADVLAVVFSLPPEPPPEA
jgi:tetratricopeptide (TPR) repeat protein